MEEGTSSVQKPRHQEKFKYPDEVEERETRLHVLEITQYLLVTLNHVDNVSGVTQLFNLSIRVVEYYTHTLLLICKLTVLGFYFM